MGIEQSMSRKGNCHDNAPIESFFNLLKRECLYRYNIDDLTELKNLVAKYINWYNNKRISLKKNKWIVPCRIQGTIHDLCAQHGY
ncbi:IS3 family transposase [Limosilactobacillus reuteri]|uniref:IS3 family transposase n=1 Tax=Limosilactobacillus reuteri TaxID=1598 RepID=UPI00146DF9A8